jgi:hypothetical protein
LLTELACVPFPELENLVMDRASHGFARLLRPLLAASLLVAASGSAAFSNENCRRLEELARQYAGVQLTSSQQQLKRKLVAWYNSNCRGTRSAEARS